MSQISSETDYETGMAEMCRLMAIGSKNVSKTDLAIIRRWGLKAQAYEQSKYVIAPPKTIAGIIELKMYDMKLKQSQLAKILHVSEAKLSLIMSGKQKPDLDFLKSVHTIMNIDANVLQEKG